MWGDLPDGIGAAALSFSETAEFESLQEDVRLCSAWKVAGGKRLLLVQADQAFACIVAAHALSQAEFLSVLVDDFENMTAEMSQGLPDGQQGHPLAGSVPLDVMAQSIKGKVGSPPGLFGFLFSALYTGEKPVKSYELTHTRASVSFSSPPTPLSIALVSAVRRRATPCHFLIRALHDSEFSRVTASGRAPGPHLEFT